VKAEPAVVDRNIAMAAEFVEQGQPAKGRSPQRSPSKKSRHPGKHHRTAADCNCQKKKNVTENTIQSLKNELLDVILCHWH
jgi:hypothetical protein